MFVVSGDFRHYDSRSRRRRGRQSFGYCDRKTKKLKVEILNPTGKQTSTAEWVTVLGPLLTNDKTVEGKKSLKRSNVKPIQAIAKKGIMKKGNCLNRHPNKHSTSKRRYETSVLLRMVYLLL